MQTVDKTVISGPYWPASDQYELLSEDSVSVVSVVTSVKPKKNSNKTKTNDNEHKKSKSSWRQCSGFNVHRKQMVEHKAFYSTAQEKQTGKNKTVNWHVWDQY